MTQPILVGALDVAELAFWAFILFFIGLVFYLRREDRREGYPLENELTGRFEDVGGVLTMPTPKRFVLPFDQGVVLAPRPDDREPVKLTGTRRVDRFDGAPIAPTGDPLVDGVGPAAWCNRAKVPDLDMEGRVRLVPLSEHPEFWLAGDDRDPRGLPFYGSDGRLGGRVVDVWIDRSEAVARYLAVEIDGGRRVLAPITMCEIEGRRVVTDSIGAHQLAGAPGLESPHQVTRYEEERAIAWFGGGYLYSDPRRSEPLL